MNEAENMEHPEDPEDPKAKAKAAADAAAAIDRASDSIDLSAAQAEAAEVAAEAADAAEGAAAETPDELELALGEVAALKDKLLRAMAETENMRRRSDREKADTRKYAVADFARDMLAVSDNLQRALGSVSDEARKDNPDLAQLLEGVELTRKELQGHFEKHGIKEINPLGEKLDPNFHQAVVQLDDPEAAQGTVVQVMQPGYVIHDRLLRAAMVGVAKGVPAQTEVKADAKSDGADVPRDGQNVDTKA